MPDTTTTLATEPLADASAPTTAAVAAPPTTPATAESGAVAAPAAASDATGTTAGTQPPGSESTPVVAPVVYDLTAPDGFAPPADFMERTVALARARGLAPEAAQAIVDVVAQEEQQRATALSAEIEGWRRATLADETLGKSPEERTAAIQRAVRVVDAFTQAQPEKGAQLKEALNKGIGNAPALVGFLAFIGAQMQEAPMVQANATTEARKLSEVELFYGVESKAT